MAASFELRIRIMGLCLFRPAGPHTGGPYLEVLMVNPKHHPKHVARVWYDRAHESPTSSQLEKKRNKKDLPADLDWSRLPVTGGTVDWLGAEVPDLRRVVGNQSANPLPGTLNTRLKLPPGTATFKLTGPDWEWDGKQDPLANEVVWTVDVNTASLPGAGSLPTLYPVQQQMELFMSNVVTKDSKYPPPKGRKPPFGSPMEHFDAFYDLYKGHTGKREAPIFKGTRMSTSYSCLPSQGK